MAQVISLNQWFTLIIQFNKYISDNYTNISFIICEVLINTIAHD
jgi:hypothetical protein